jgi:hypothetical protein
VLEPPEDQGAVSQLLLGGKSFGAKGKEGDERDVGKVTARTEEEEKIRAAAMARGRGRDGG